MRLTGLVLAATGAAALSTPALAQDESLASVDEEVGEVPPGPNTGSRPPGVPEASLEDGPNAGAIHLELGLDVTSAYFSRGLRYEDEGFIAQPYGSISITLVDNDEWTADAILGAWNSLHDRATDAGTEDDFMEHWYEADYRVGLSVTHAEWTLAAEYLWATSPSDAWETIPEVDLTVTFDDSEWMGDLSLQPTAMLAIETGSDYTDGADTDRGTYLELSIEPGFDVESASLSTVAISFPASIGLSLGNYYEDAEGNDSTFGFAAVGAAASWPLPIPDRFGIWVLSGSVSVLFLGDTAAEFNDEDEVQVIGTIGVSLAY